MDRKGMSVSGRYLGGRRNFSRREFLGLGTAASAGLVLFAGCAGESGGSGGTSVGFFHWRGEDSEVFSEIIKQFQEEYPDLQVQQNAAPAGSYDAELQSNLIGGEGGADLFASEPGGQFLELAGQDVYVDLSDADFRDRFQDKYITAGENNGRQLAYPYQVVFNIPIYNKGMFNRLELEPPDSWEGFLELCEALKQEGVAPIAFAGSDASGGSPGQFINPMLMNNQPSDDIWSRVEAGEAQVTEDWFVGTLAQIQELNELGYFQEDALGTSKEGATALFAQEEAGMLAMGSYLMASISQQNPDIEQGLLAPITVPASEKKYDGIYTSTLMLAVNSQSEKQEGARQLLEFLTRPEIATEYANGTAQLVPVDGLEANTEQIEIQQPWLDREILFQPRYTISNTEITTALDESVQEVMSGTAPEEVAADLQAVVDRTAGQ